MTDGKPLRFFRIFGENESRNIYMPMIYAYFLAVLVVVCQDLEFFLKKLGLCWRHVAGCQDSRS